MHTIVYSCPFLAIKGGMARGRPPKGKENRGRITLPLPVETIKGVRRAAKRRGQSQPDYIDDAVRPRLIADKIIKETRNAKG
jgi:hypothetical protein